MPFGGVALGRVCVCSLPSRLVSNVYFTLFFAKENPAKENVSKIIRIWLIMDMIVFKVVQWGCHKVHFSPLGHRQCSGRQKCSEVSEWSIPNILAGNTLVTNDTSFWRCEKNNNFLLGQSKLCLNGNIKDTLEKDIKSLKSPFRLSCCFKTVLDQSF